MTATDRDAARAALRTAHLKRIAAETLEIDAVAQARTAGVTWDEIGTDVGMAGPNAHRKYARQLQETRVVTRKSTEPE